MVITIDTNIIVKAFKHQEPDHLHIAGMIGRNGRELGCDTSIEGTIFREYRQNVGGEKGYIKWFRRLFQKQAIACQSRYDVPRAHKMKLKPLGCHEPSDLVFIGVAFYSDKLLISEDSDVGKGPKGHLSPHCDALDYMTKEMELIILDAEEACHYLDNLPI